jgi:predicted nuclease of restriction endonuclease-like (RecB) superfamily
MNDRYSADDDIIGVSDAPVEVIVGYDDLLRDVLDTIADAKSELARTTNGLAVDLYWRIGRSILDRQQDAGYGDAVVDRLSTDLTSRFPGQRGWSPRNLWYMRNFALAWERSEILQTRLQNLSWSHHQVLLDSVPESPQRHWYVDTAIKNRWSVRLLTAQIKNQLYERTGTAPSNFDTTVPDLQGDDLNRLATDPYRLDFLQLDEAATERQLEAAVVERISEFLTHLGRGFAYMGRQYRLTVGRTDFFLDLLFYNTHLHAYCVFELKTQNFAPAHAGQLAFYVTAIERQLRTDRDNPTIGVLLVPDKDNVVVEYTLASLTSPMTVATYTHNQLPEDLRRELPGRAEIAQLLAQHDVVEQ